MHWINMSEKEILKVWSIEQYTEKLTKMYLPQPDTLMESYWLEYDNDKNIIEYDFSDFSELSALLKSELSEEYFNNLILPLTVATFKEYKSVSNNNFSNSKVILDDKSNKDEFSIPEFVYVF